MTETIQLCEGVTLTCFRDRRFKQGCLSVQLVRPMDREEAALNALVPDVLLRGCRTAPDLRAVTLRLDRLYGASVSPTLQRVGDRHIPGLYCGFLEDRFALPGERVFAPLAAFLRELLHEPVLEAGCFRRDYVESEKQNLLSAIQAQINDKRYYADSRLLALMCRADTLGIPRLGTEEAVRAATAASVFAHYRRLLTESPVELFYVGSLEPAAVAGCLAPLFPPRRAALPPQTGFQDGGAVRETEEMALAQSRLTLGFTTPVTVRDGDFPAMQTVNLLFGGGMTGKLFTVLRERMSLCYDVGSVYHGSKGVLTVSMGLDADRAEEAQAETIRQLAACQRGQITDLELTSAKKAILSGIESVHDTPGAIQRYYSAARLGGLALTPREYAGRVEALTLEDVVRAAGTVRLHSTYFLKGVEA